MMELTKTAKVQIYPSDSGKVFLLKSMKAYAAACCHVSEYVFATKDLSQVSIHHRVYSDLRSDYGLPSQMACNAIRTVIASYRTILSNNDEWTECEYHTPQMTLS